VFGVLPLGIPPFERCEGWAAGAEIASTSSTSKSPLSAQNARPHFFFFLFLSSSPIFHSGLVWILVLWYIGTMIDEAQLQIERVQTGVRMEKRILKVLKAFAEYHDMTLGDVLEGIVLHVFDGKTPFSPASLEKIRDLKKFYELDLDSSASHRLKEIKAKSGRKRREEA